MECEGRKEQNEEQELFIKCFLLFLTRIAGRNHFAIILVLSSTMACQSGKSCRCMSVSFLSLLGQPFSAFFVPFHHPFFFFEIGFREE